MSIIELNIKFLVILPAEVTQHTLLATPLIRCLYQQVENAEVHLLGISSQQEYFFNSPYTDHFFLWNQKDLISTLQDEFFHYIIDLESSIRTWRMKNKLKVLDFSINKNTWRKKLYIKLGVNTIPNDHFVNASLKLLKYFSVTDDLEGLDVFTKTVQLTNQNPTPDGGYILILQQSSSTNTIPTETILRICTHITKPIVLLNISLQESQPPQKSAQKIQYHSVSQDIDTIPYIKEAKVVITGFNQFMHIATALKKKTITLWGNSDRIVDEEAWKPHDLSTNFEVSNIKCRPCSIFTQTKCPKEHFNCMTKHQGEDVGKYANEIY